MDATIQAQMDKVAAAHTAYLLANTKLEMANAHYYDVSFGDRNEMHDAMWAAHRLFQEERTKLQSMIIEMGYANHPKAAVELASEA